MAHGDKNLAPKLQIEAVQTVTPFKATDPRQTLRVLATDPVGSGIFRRCLNIVVYYKKALEEDSGWIAAGWIKESLGRVLAEQPMLSGRLRRSEDGGVGELEIVSNDSGVRLIEAKISITMSEFLDDQLQESEDAESELVFWKDIDDQNPQFSPLFYLQMTNFECGGYSIGISCNLLLADILIKENFFQKWANIHKDILSQNNSPKSTHIFYLPYLKKASCNPDIPISSNQVKKKGKTMIFKITDDNLISLEKESNKKLILARVEEVERELGNNKMASKFPVFLRESSKSDKIKIEYCSKYVDEMVHSHELDFKNQVRRASWDDLGASEIDFGQGNKPSRVAYWIGSILDGFVVATSSPSDSDQSTTSGFNIIVSVPS
ncbi:hypothetical protein ACOSP7_025444 [Xanthoceras sorbifolium]